jgi:hypothetical protein
MLPILISFLYPVVLLPLYYPPLQPYFIPLFHSFKPPSIPPLLTSLPSLQVQTACCSALCTLIEVAGPDPVTPFLPQILSFVQQAFAVYGIKSSLILVDTIGTIADIVGDALADK